MKFYVLADGEFEAFDNKAAAVEVALGGIETYREMARRDGEWPDAVETVKVVMSDISFDGEIDDLVSDIEASGEVLFKALPRAIEGHDPDEACEYALVRMDE